MTTHTVSGGGSPAAKLLAPLGTVCKCPPIVGAAAALGKGGATRMGFTDKIKGLIGGNKETIKTGVDKAADLVQTKTPDSVDAQVEKGADVVKDVVDKID